MNQVIAIVKPYLVEKILDSLRRSPLEAVSVREVKGVGRQKSYLDRYSDSEYTHAYLSKIEISVFVEKTHTEEIVRKLIDTARTGRIGDGKIFILPAQPHDLFLAQTSS